MAGFFSNNGEGTDANAARQFDREFAANPDSFGGEGGGIIGRLIGARQPRSKITTTVLDDQTPPQQAADTPPPPSSNISSAGPLVGRILGAMRPPAPATPSMNPMTGPVGGGQNPNSGPAGFSPMQAPEGTPGPNVNAYGMPPTPMPPPQSPPGQFGGAPGTDPRLAGIPPQYAVPPQGGSQPPPQGGSQPQPQPQQPGWLRNLFSRRPPPPQQAPQSLQIPYNPAHHPSGPRPMPGANIPAGGMTPEAAADFNDWYRQAQKGPGGPGNYAQGGYLRMMRGGYPSDLMMGMPMRRDYAHGSYVAEDGQGDGRSDHVEARLSPGEFVMDAESVSMLGNGNNSAGAKKLEQMRQGLRRQKGKALAKGKFSPDAKNPEAYMRGKS